MNQNHLAPIRRALLSTSDKSGIVELARFLSANGTTILSTGGTARLLRQREITVTEVADYTGFPEIMGGRLKTLHPKIHGGLLGGREQDLAAASEHGIEMIDLLAVNLYPFEQTVRKPGVTLEQAVENVDVGGPAMIRAAAKNHERVTVIVDPADYETVMQEMRDNDGATTQALKSKLAAKAFRRTAEYDAAISRWLHAQTDNAESSWPALLNPSFSRALALRYGENPHQKAALYADAGGGLADAEQLQGKTLSYNNVADASAAYECVRNFEAVACVIVKHATPCAAACADSLDRAYRRAVEADPISAFGGVVAFNRTLDAQTAREITDKQFVEVVIAPDATKDALEVLNEKPALRALRCPPPRGDGRRYTSVLGGVLVQEEDLAEVTEKDFTVKTRRAPSKDEFKSLLFAWRVAKFVKSNAIVLACGTVTAGVGAGQTSRVDSVRIAVEKSREHGFADKPTVMASDAFFPFRDGLDAAVEAGVTAVIQPGGSVRDEQLIAAADEHGLAMVFTGVRHFRH